MQIVIRVAQDGPRLHHPPLHGGLRQVGGRPNGQLIVGGVQKRPLR